VVFDIGDQSVLGLTNAAGLATVSVTPVVPPGSYTVQASVKATATYASSSATSALEVTRAPTTLTLPAATVTVQRGQPTGIVASLRNSTSGVQLGDKSVVFVLTNATGSVARSATTDTWGDARLPELDLAAGTYTVKAYFSGTIPVGTPPLSFTDELYLPSSSATTVTLNLTGPTPVNQAPVVRADMGVAGLQEIGYQSNVIVLTGSFTDADGTGPFTASVRWTPTGAFTPFVLNNNSDFIALYVYPSAGTRIATVKVCDKLGACGTDDVTIRSNVTQKVTPVRECVVDRGSATNPRYQARFGYNNPATFPIYIPTLLSAENGFNSSPFHRGQPQVFKPGNPRNVFTTTFNSGSISWKLNGTTVTANSSSPPC
jgi:hypothetical protein